MTYSATDGGPVSTINIVTLADRPDLMPLVEQAENEGFAEFLVHDPVWQEAMPPAMEKYPECQIFVLDEDHRPLFVGNAVRIRWNGDPADLPAGTHAALRASLDCPPAKANTLCGIQGVAIGAGRGSGRSGDLMLAFKQLAAENQWRMVVPVRTTWKDRYPLIPMESYVGWHNVNGEAFDPWLRVQDRVGGRRLHVSHHALVIEASVKQWERWTGLAMPTTGSYVIEGGQSPVEIDREHDTGRYSESHVWYEYPLASREL